MLQAEGEGASSGAQPAALPSGNEGVRVDVIEALAWSGGALVLIVFAASLVLGLLQVWLQKLREGR